ncbi:hypothetical protein CAPTEDRAFT_218185 [Capitella teleta]|uniref:Uncharacterized protein n=1 Tax=Capitella teleta TaxID=283909 RepID=R7TSG0_CAPTE|nr:hypothetical protein CAPTEDRAFT_218185 [Capitella teleta]|eukprot:ELT94421.1 hypothetical protein CAPTEDRAFT_218185 [Capitella teleta]
MLEALNASSMVEKHHAEMRLYVGNNFNRKHVPSDASQDQQSPHVPLNYKRTNASTGRTAASTGTVLVRLCETEQRREASSLPHLKKMLTTLRDHGGSAVDGATNSGDSDRLPVVELRPFTQKQWRPAKSIPSPTYSDPPPFIPPMFPANNYMQRSKTEITGNEFAPVDPDRSSFPVRAPDVGCPRSFSVAADRKHVPSDASQNQQSPHVPLNYKRTNASTGRTAASTGTVLVRLCETEQRREASSLPHLKKMLTTLRDHGGSAVDGATNSGDSDRLPVVELRPFTQKQWRPAKSIPSPTYSDPPPFIPPMFPANNYMQRSKTEITGNEFAPVDPDRSSFPVRAPDVGCPRSFSVAADRWSGHPRSRKTNSNHSAPLTAHGFASKIEREKSTLDDIRNGVAPAVLNFLHSTSREPEIEQGMHVHGTGIDYPLRASPFYQRPWEYYKKLSNAHHHAEAELFESLYRTLEQMPNSCLDESIYDAFDRSHTLTSINVNPVSVSSRRSDKGRLTTEVDEPHRLGVTNSLDLLSHYGSPIHMEQHLNVQLKNTLNGIRRAKPMNISSLKAVKSSEWNLTQGEKQIYTRRLANTSCSTRSSSRVFSPNKRAEAPSISTPEQSSPSQIEVRKSKLYDSKAGLRGSEAYEVKEKVNGRLDDSVKETPLEEKDDVAVLAQPDPVAAERDRVTDGQELADYYTTD